MRQSWPIIALLAFTATGSFYAGYLSRHATESNEISRLRADLFVERMGRYNDSKAYAQAVERAQTRESGIFVNCDNPIFSTSSTTAVACDNSRKVWGK